MAGKKPDVEEAIGNLIAVLAGEYIPPALTVAVTASARAEMAGDHDLAAQHFDHAWTLTCLGVDCGLPVSELYAIGGQALIDARNQA